MRGHFAPCTHGILCYNDEKVSSCLENFSQDLPLDTILSHSGQATCFPCNKADFPNISIHARHVLAECKLTRHKWQDAEITIHDKSASKRISLRHGQQRHRGNGLNIRSRCGIDRWRHGSDVRNPCGDEAADAPPGRPRPAEIDGRRPTVTPENGKAQVAEEAALGLASPEGPRAWLGTLRTGVNRRGPA